MVVYIRGGGFCFDNCIHMKHTKKGSSKYTKKKESFDRMGYTSRNRKKNPYMYN